MKPRRHRDEHGNATGLLCVDQGTHQGTHGLFDFSFNPDDNRFYVHPHGSLEVLRTYSTIDGAAYGIRHLRPPAVIEVDRPESIAPTPSRFLPAVVS